MTVPHLSEYELDRLAAGEAPNERQRAALEAVPALRAALEERKQGLGAFPDLDERRLLAQIRTKASQGESATASLGAWVFHWREALLGAVAMAALFGVAQVVFEKEPVEPSEQMATNASLPPGKSARPEIRPLVLADGSRDHPSGKQPGRLRPGYRESRRPSTSGGQRTLRGSKESCQGFPGQDRKCSRSSCGYQVCGFARQ